MGSKVAAMRGEDVPPPIKSEVRLKSELEELVRKTVEQCVTACAAVLALLTSVAAIFGRSLTLARTTTTDAATSPQQQQQQQSKQSSDDDDEESEDECGIHVCEACWKDSPWSAEVDEEEFGREEESLEKRSRRKKWRSPTPPPPPRRVTRSKAKEEETEDDLLVFKDTRETLV